MQAARRVADQLGVDAQYVVGDARHLPFADESVDVVFSYSVFQHFSKRDALAAFEEIGRVLKPGGELADPDGEPLRREAASGTRRASGASASPARSSTSVTGARGSCSDELAQRVGPTELSVDGFFTLNPQPTDLALLPARYRAVVRTSETLRRVSETVKPLTLVADSVYARSRRG